MKTLGALLLVMLMGFGYGRAGDTSDTPAHSTPAPEPFPIVTRFELPRDYGYFIGDEIPLTLTIEAQKGVVIDLVNLPREGEQHGLFEIRHLAITSSTTKEQIVYRAAYTLQYFGAAPLTAQFEPLEILYARPAAEEPHEKRITQYKSLFTQPAVLNISRLGPYRATQALDPKGPLSDRRRGLIWIPSLLGLSLLGASVFGWTKEWQHIRKHAQRRGHPPVSAREQALQALCDSEPSVSRLEACPGSAGVTLGRILRGYLHQAFDIPAFTLTTAELAHELADTPQTEEMLHLLEVCDLLKYQPANDPSLDTQQLWLQARRFFEQLEQGEAA
jgi:hypothetical protein